jgi:hypothetical protein
MSPACHSRKELVSCSMGLSNGPVPGSRRPLARFWRKESPLTAKHGGPRAGRWALRWSGTGGIERVTYLLHRVAALRRTLRRY